MFLETCKIVDVEFCENGFVRSFCQKFHDPQKERKIFVIVSSLRSLNQRAFLNGISMKRR
jgi:hypothetical protein